MRKKQSYIRFELPKGLKLRAEAAAKSRWIGLSALCRQSLAFFLDASERSRSADGSPGLELVGADRDRELDRSGPSGGGQG